LLTFAAPSVHLNANIPWSVLSGYNRLSHTNFTGYNTSWLLQGYGYGPLEAGMTIRLPQDPKELDYEDQIAAALLATGHYIETRLALKKGTEEVLEFDAIATPINDYQNRKIIEVKSGDWGSGDIFKLYGQMAFTGNNAGWLIHKKNLSASKQAAVEEIAKKLPVTTIHIDNSTDYPFSKMPIGLELSDKAKEVIFSTSWWVRSAERIAQGRFKNWLKSHNPQPLIIEKTKLYKNAIDESLFKESPLNRAHSLYNAYRICPSLTSSLIEYISSNGSETVSTVRDSANNEGEKLYLQYVMALEIQARIAIIKNAYDQILLEKDKMKIDSPWNGMTWDTIYKSILPESFKSGMITLDSYQHANKIPYFLYIIIEVFGGYYFPNNQNELNAISETTGIPEDDIPKALSFLDSFFPIPKGWIHQGNGVNLIKGVPAYIRGAGSFSREELYGENWLEEIPQLERRVRGWHNALYKTLEPTLKVTS
jgi:hypothetical protein